MNEALRLQYLGMKEVPEKDYKAGLKVVVVTGSKQPSDRSTQQ